MMPRLTRFDADARSELSAAVALAWSDTHLADALDWARALPQDSVQHRVLTDLSYEVARIDPVESLRLAVELPADDARDRLLLHALRQWTLQEPEQSQAWVLQIAPSPLREQALAAVATALASKDGDSAARFAVVNVLPGPDWIAPSSGLFNAGRRRITAIRRVGWISFLKFPSGQLRRKLCCSWQLFRHRNDKSRPKPVGETAKADKRVRIAL